MKRKMSSMMLIGVFCLFQMHGLKPFQINWACPVCFRVNQDDMSRCDYCGHTK